MANKRLFSRVLGADYMESFQPGLNFCPVNRTEFFPRIHARFETDRNMVLSDIYEDL
jgi:hypothetical protein